MVNILFQYYKGNIRDSKPVGYVTLSQFLYAIKHPRARTIQLLNRIYQAREAGDKTLKDKLKTDLPGFTPAVNVSRFRRIDNITRFTGLLVLDFDNIDYAEEFREYLFFEYNWIVASWLSASKQGVRALVRIPVIEIAGRDPMEARLEYWEYFYGVASELENYNGFDEAPRNCVLPLFYSHDPDLLFRHDAVIYSDKGEVIGKKPEIQASPTPVNFSSANEQRIIKMIDSGLAKISGDGHTQLRALCRAVGGYIANRYIDFNTAKYHISSKIMNHSYLKKGVQGYIKTAIWAMNEGQKYPLHFT